MFSKRKWLLIIAALTAFLIISGCSDNGDSDEEQTEDLPTTEETETEEQTQTAPDKLDSDQDLEAQLEAEQGIESVMVQVVEGENNAVNVDIEINDELQSSADELIDEYSELIAEKYPDRTIDIIVVKDGKIVKQETLD